MEMVIWSGNNSLIILSKKPQSLKISKVNPKKSKDMSNQMYNPKLKSMESYKRPSISKILKKWHSFKKVQVKYISWILMMETCLLRLFKLILRN